MANDVALFREGVALQGAQRMPMELIRQDMATRAAQKKADKEDGVSVDDFHLQNKELLPVYSRAQQKIAEEYVKKGQEYYQKTGSWRKAKNMLSLEMPAFKQRFDEVRANNDNTKRLIELNPKEYLVPNQQSIAQAAYNANTTPEQWNALSDPDNLLKTDGTSYSITVPLTANKDLDAILTKHKDNLEKVAQGAPQSLGNYRVRQNYMEQAAPQAIESVASDLISDHDNWQNFRIKNKEWLKAWGENNKVNGVPLDAYSLNSDPNIRHAAALEWAKTQLPKRASYEEYNAEKPLASEVNQKATIAVNETDYIPRKNEKGETMASLPVQQSYTVTLPEKPDGGGYTFKIVGGRNMSTDKEVNDEVVSVKNVKIGRSVVNGKDDIYAFITVPKERAGTSTARTTEKPNRKESTTVTETSPKTTDTETIAVPYDRVRGDILSYTKKGNQKGFDYYEVEKVEPIKSSPGKTATPKETKTEKLYIVGSKAYKESSLVKQGYDISKLKEYNGN